MKTLFLITILLISQLQAQSPELEEQLSIGKKVDECFEKCQQDDMEVRSKCYQECFDLLTPALEKLKSEFGPLPDPTNPADHHRLLQDQFGNADIPFPEDLLGEDFKMPEISDQEIPLDFDFDLDDIPHPLINDQDMPYADNNDVVEEVVEEEDNGERRRNLQESFDNDEDLEKKHREQIEERFKQFRDGRLSDRFGRRGKQGGHFNRTDSDNNNRDDIFSQWRNRRGNSTGLGDLGDFNFPTQEQIEEQRKNFELMMECRGPVSKVMQECARSSGRDCDLSEIDEKCKEQACKQLARFRLTSDLCD